jgi:hypothetical protein
MKLAYVGAKPKVSSRGVTFDQTKPDKYTFLNAVIELLEAFDINEKVDKNLHLESITHKSYVEDELVEMLSKHCENPQKAFDTCQEDTNALIVKYTTRVENNNQISKDEKIAWLGNIKYMRDYYLQYITNENAYRCALHALADQIGKSHIDDIVFPMGRNYGLVASHLVDVLRDHKPAFDATLSIYMKNGIAMGKLDMNRSTPIKI